MLISFIYTRDFEQTTTAAVTQLIYVMFCIACAVILSNPKILIVTLKYVFIVLLVLSYFGVIFLPERSIHVFDPNTSLARNLEGARKGIFFHKNYAGGVLMYLSIISIFEFFRKPNIVMLFIFALNTFFLYMAQSLTAQIILFVSFPIACIIFSFSKDKIIFTVVSSIFVLLITLFPFIEVSYIHDLFGVHFDSRYYVWKYVLMYLDGSIFHGFGYNAVFGKNSGLAYFTNNTFVTEKIGHAHNGVIDMVSQFGLIALLPVFFLYRNAFRLLREWTLSKSDDDYSFLAYVMVVAAILRSTMEPDLLSNRAHWVIFLLLMFSMSIQYAKRQKL